MMILGTVMRNWKQIIFRKFPHVHTTQVNVSLYYNQWEKASLFISDNIYNENLIIIYICTIEDDINQATFFDTNTIVKSVGCQGITCVSTPNDYGVSNYVLSNSKDQSMRLCDLRSMNRVNELTSTWVKLRLESVIFIWRNWIYKNIWY
eukprot:491656_1